MATGYEVKMYADISRIADSMQKIAKQYDGPQYVRITQKPLGIDFYADKKAYHKSLEDYYEDTPEERAKMDEALRYADQHPGVLWDIGDGDYLVRIPNN